MVIGSANEKIWIDLDNSPHVPFFAPIIAQLQKRGHPVLLTARDCFQVRELADSCGLEYQLIGRHYGKRTTNKIAGLCIRAAQLLPRVLAERPRFAVSHCSRAQLLVAAVLGIPTLFIGDYEFSTAWAVVQPTWFMCPEVIPTASLRCDPVRVLKYPGIKEDVYVPSFVPDHRIRSDLGIQETEIMVTLRPPATEAHYHNPQSEELFAAVLEFLGDQVGVKLVVLPRNEKQAEELKTRHPGLFREGKVLVPPRVVDGLNLIWHSDLVVSGGGTMNREAAALGVPVYSTFRGPTGAVDQYLSAAGRLVLLESTRDVPAKIAVTRRFRPAEPPSGSRTALDCIVEHVAARAADGRRRGRWET